MAMDRATQTAVLKRLLDYVETKTTALAEAPWRNDVGVLPLRRPRTARAAASLPRTAGADGALLRLGKPRQLPDRRLCRRARPDRARPRRQAACFPQRLPASRRQGCAGLRHRFGVRLPLSRVTYDVQGGLRGIPDERSFPGVRAERGGLTPLPLVEKHGWSG